jgi:hypothetical protein
MENLEKNIKDKIRLRRPTPEELFYKLIHERVENSLTLKNPNFKSYYYAQRGGFEFQKEVIRMAENILEEMEKLKHLIIWPEDESPTSAPE